MCTQCQTIILLTNKQKIYYKKGNLVIITYKIHTLITLPTFLNIREISQRS
jgi:hypothetical protein